MTEPTGWISPMFVNSKFAISCQWTVLVDVDYWVNLKIEEMNLFIDILGRCMISAVKVRMTLRYRKSNFHQLDFCFKYVNHRMKDSK